MMSDIEATRAHLAQVRAVLAASTNPLQIELGAIMAERLEKDLALFDPPARRTYH